MTPARTQATASFLASRAPAKPPVVAATIVSKPGCQAIAPVEPGRTQAITTSVAMGLRKQLAIGE